MSLRGVEENRQKPEGAVKTEICLAQGHGQGLLVRITIKEVLTVCEKEKKNLYCSVNMPICEHAFVNPHYTLLTSCNLLFSETKVHFAGKRGSGEGIKERKLKK